MLRDMFYVPSIDGTLINWDPRNITREDDKTVAKSLEFFKSLDFLNGFSKYEGGAVFQRLLKLADAEQFRPSNEDMENIVETALRIADNKTFSDLVYNTITSEYTYWEDPINPEKIRIQVVKLYSDMFRAIPSIQMSRIHDSSQSSPNNFMFLLSGKPSLNVPPTPSWLDGANHADELLFLSAFLERFPFAQRWEKELTYTMLTYWSNFVRTGDPNGEEAGNDALPYWPRYEFKKQEYIDLDRNVTARSYFEMKAANLWLNLLPQLLKQQKTDECPDCPTCNTSTAPPALQEHSLNMRLFVLVSISLMTACNSFAC